MAEHSRAGDHDIPRRDAHAGTSAPPLRTPTNPDTALECGPPAPAFEPGSGPRSAAPAAQENVGASAHAPNTPTDPDISLRVTDPVCGMSVDPATAKHRHE